MPTRNVVLTDQQHDAIDSLVKSGRYQNASEVLREGLRLVEQREKEDALKLTLLRDAAQIGLRDLESGRFRDFDLDELEGVILGMRGAARAER